ncbi:unnamed protein product [Arctogadus glacialis]
MTLTRSRQPPFSVHDDANAFIQSHVPVTLSRVPAPERRSRCTNKNTSQKQAKGRHSEALEGTFPHGLSSAWRLFSPSGPVGSSGRGTF